ncbi:hypothetical protein P152DRAFT_452776 [Eremomyces bilateralis CBS 781.70]|uniref:Uncharacterized protein n=1 Tax=Eremomyces bilateralis CBS 781.70 TaxID=1392243 RepID=A0A6G1FS98_9PEZI|nr:uncharacterized protein P152DRAFT_452776 [Eremomyces bilateralis CBS 781.70]KAF1808561.1 hypothetical protein P152DRAFT_452776 [Eremomyces bilateralis CBS 781.70]
MVALGAGDRLSRITIPARTKSAKTTSVKQPALRSQQGKPIDPRDLSRRLELVLAEKQAKERHREFYSVGKKGTAKEKKEDGNTFRSLNYNIANWSLRPTVQSQSAQSAPRPSSFHQASLGLDVAVDHSSEKHQRHTIAFVGAKDEVVQSKTQPNLATVAVPSARPNSVATVQPMPSFEPAVLLSLDAVKAQYSLLENSEKRAVNEKEFQRKHLLVPTRLRDSHQELLPMDSIQVPASPTKAAGNSGPRLDANEASPNSVQFPTNVASKSLTVYAGTPPIRESIRLVPGPRSVTPMALESPNFQATRSPVEGSDNTSPSVDIFPTIPSAVAPEQSGQSKQQTDPFPMFEEGFADTKPGPPLQAPNFSTPNLRPLTPKSPKDSNPTTRLKATTATQNFDQLSGGPEGTTTDQQDASDRPISYPWAPQFPSTGAQSSSIRAVDPEPLPNVSVTVMQQDDGKDLGKAELDIVLASTETDSIQAFKDFKLDLEPQPHDAEENAAGPDQKDDTQALVKLQQQLKEEVDKARKEADMFKTGLRERDGFQELRRDSGTLGALDKGTSMRSPDKSKSVVGETHAQRSPVEVDRRKSQTDSENRKSRDVAGGQSLLDERAKTRSSVVVDETLTVATSPDEATDDGTRKRRGSINENLQGTGAVGIGFLPPGEVQRRARRERQKAREEARQKALQDLDRSPKDLPPTSPARQSVIGPAQPMKRTQTTSDPKSRRKSVGATSIRRVKSIFGGNKARLGSSADVPGGHTKPPVPTEPLPKSNVASTPASPTKFRHTIIEDTRKPSLQPVDSVLQDTTSPTTSKNESHGPDQAASSVRTRPDLVLDLPLVKKLGVEADAISPQSSQVLTPSSPHARPTTAPAPRSPSSVEQLAPGPLSSESAAPLDEKQTKPRRQTLEERKVRELAAELGKEDMNDASFKLLRERERESARRKEMGAKEWGTDGMGDDERVERAAGNDGEAVKEKTPKKPKKGDKVEMKEKKEKRGGLRKLFRIGGKKA